MVRLTEEFAGTVFAPESTLTYGGSAPASPIADNPFEMPAYSPPPPATLTPPAIQPNPFAAPEYVPPQQDYTVTPSPIQQNPFTNQLFIPPAPPPPQPIMGGFDANQNLVNQFTLGQQQESLNNGFQMRGYEDGSFQAIDPALENAQDSFRASLVMENPLAQPAPQPWAPDVGAGLGLDMFSAPQPEPSVLTPTQIGTDASSMTGAYSPSEGSSLGTDLGGGFEFGSNAADLRAYARQVAQKYGLDPALFEAQIQQESGFQLGLTSSAGAQGIAQFMPGTAASMGVNVNDPYSSLDGAARLMRQLLDQFNGDIRLALAAYNAGPGAVEKYGGVPPFAETQAYVNNISNARGSMGAGVSANGLGPSWSRFSISQGFGPTNEPLDSGYGGYAHFNKGLDFAMPVGTPIDPVVPGVVVRVENDPNNSTGWGKFVWVQDAAGRVHNYGHLSATNVSVGQQVTTTDVLGLSGNTGKSTGPHLSWDIKNENGEWIDPTPLLGGGAARTLTPNPLENPFDPTQAPQRSARVLPFVESENQEMMDSNLRSIFAGGLEQESFLNDRRRVSMLEDQFSTDEGFNQYVRDVSGETERENILSNQFGTTLYNQLVEDIQTGKINPREVGLQVVPLEDGTLALVSRHQNVRGYIDLALAPLAIGGSSVLRAFGDEGRMPSLGPLDDVPGLSKFVDYATSPLSLAGFGAGIGAQGLRAATNQALTRGLPAIGLGVAGENIGNEIGGTPGAIVGGVAGGLLGWNAPGIVRGTREAAESLPGVLAREAGETPFSARATGLQPGVGAINPETGLPFELQGLIGGADEAIPQGSRTSLLKQGDTVTNRTGEQFVVEKDFNGTVNGFVTVRTEAGEVVRRKRGMLLAEEATPSPAPVAGAAEPLAPTRIGETPEATNRAALDYLDEATGLRKSGVTQQEIHEGRINQLNSMQRAMDEADAAGLKGAEHARFVLDAQKGHIIRTLPEALPQETIGNMWNTIHVAIAEAGANFNANVLRRAMWKVETQAPLTPGEATELRKVFGDEIVDSFVVPRTGKVAVENVANPGTTAPLAGFEELAGTTPPMLRENPFGDLIPERPQALTPEQSMRAADRPRLAGEQRAQEDFWTGVQRESNREARIAAARELAQNVRDPNTPFRPEPAPPRFRPRETVSPEVQRQRDADNFFPWAKDPAFSESDTQLGMSRPRHDSETAQNIADQRWREVTGQPKAPRVHMSSLTPGRILGLAKATIAEAFALPRALKTSWDLSAPLRQGIIQMVAHPRKAFGIGGEEGDDVGAFWRMLKAFASEEAYQRYQKLWDTSPHARTMKESGLFRAVEATDGLTNAEEAFMSRWFEKIPLVRGSQRAYVTFLNEMRRQVWTQVWEGMPPLERTLENAKTWSHIVNASTGRGSLPGALSNSGQLLASIFFAPRYLISRPEYLIRAGKAIASGPQALRKEAIRELGAYVGTVTTFLGVGHLAGLWSVELDPRASDFGKLSIEGPDGADFQYDLFAGYTQIARAMVRVTTGEAVSSAGYKYKVGRGDALAQFARSKLNPVVAEMWNQLDEKDYLGKPIDNGLFPLLNRLYGPISIEDAVEGYKAANLWGVVGVLPAIFGAGMVIIPGSMTEKLNQQSGRDFWDWMDKEPKAAEAWLNAQDQAPLKAEYDAWKADQLDDARAELAGTRADETVGFAALETAKEERATEQQAAIERFATHKDGAQFRKDLDEISARYAGKLSTLEQYRLFGETGELPDDPIAAAEVQWYSLYGKAPIDKETGKPDFEWIEAEREKLKATFSPEQKAHIEQQEAENFAALPPELQELKTAREAIVASGWFDLEEGKLQFLRDNPGVAADIVPLMEKWGYSEMTVQAFRETEARTVDQQNDDARLESGALGIEEWAQRTADRASDLAKYKQVIYEGLDPRTVDLVDAYFNEIAANKERNDGFLNFNELEKWETENPGPTAAYEAQPVTGLTPKAIELKQAGRDLRDSGYYDLYDEAWAGIVRRAPQFQQYEDFSDFQGEWQQDRFQELVARGLSPEEASRQAGIEFENHPINDILSQFKNEGLEWPWLQANAQVAYNAWRLGKLDLTQEQQYWIQQQARRNGW